MGAQKLRTDITERRLVQSTAPKTGAVLESLTRYPVQNIWRQKTGRTASATKGGHASRPSANSASRLSQLTRVASRSRNRQGVSSRSDKGVQAKASGVGGSSLGWVRIRPSKDFDFGSSQEGDSRVPR